MKNYIIKNHLALLLLILILVCTKIIVNSVDYQTWRLCQGLNLAFRELLPEQSSTEIFIQSCSREKVFEYLIKTPNSKSLPSDNN